MHHLLHGIDVAKHAHACMHACMHSSSSSERVLSEPDGRTTCLQLMCLSPCRGLRMASTSTGSQRPRRCVVLPPAPRHDCGYCVCERTSFIAYDDSGRSLTVILLSAAYFRSLLHPCTSFFRADVCSFVRPPPSHPLDACMIVHRCCVVLVRRPADRTRHDD